LIGKDQKPGNYTVRLYLGKKAGAQPGDCVFSVELQGKTLAKKLDVAKKAGNKPGLIKEFTGIHVENTLDIQLNTLYEPSGPNTLPVLCGMEIIREE